MADFLWIEWNRQKIANHALSTDEVEFAWQRRQDLRRRVHPVNGVYWESIGECPSGRRITMVWRWNEGGQGDAVFIITAF